MTDKPTTPNSPPYGDPIANIWPLLDRYLSGECSREEREKIERLIAQDGRIRAVYNDLTDIRAVASTTPKWDSTGGMLRELHDRIGLESPSVSINNEDREKASSPPAVIEEGVGGDPFLASQSTDAQSTANGTTSYRTGIPREWISPAWMFRVIVGVVLAAVGVGVYSHSSSDTGINSGSSYTTVSTALGQRATTQLPDGSRITLAPGSTLRYGESYNKSSREVTLDGEGYFDVIPNTNRPFVISAGSSRTVVLGTTFSVRKYTSDSVVKVVVSTGRVSIGDKVISRGDIARVGNDGDIQISHTTNPELLLGWTRDTLAFERTTGSEILTTLGRWYGVEFLLESPELLEERYSGTFAGVSLESAVNLVSALMAVKPTYEGSKIVLR